MRKFLVPVLLAAIFLSISVGVFAASFKTTGNPGDTHVGTTIRSSIEVNTFNYKDMADNDRDTEYGNTIEVTVAAEKGLSSDTILPPEAYGIGFGGGIILLYVYATPGSTEVFTSYITNEGNAPLTVTASIFAISYNGTAGNNWDVGIWEGATNHGTAYTKVLNDNSDYPRLDFKITPASTETDSPDMSSVFFKVSMTTEAVIHAGNENHDSHGGQYTGANELTYGGLVGSGPSGIDVSVEAPIIAISRSATVDSPSTYVGWGGIHDQVPGSMWTFTIVYTNEGTGNATNVIIVDKVPANCVAYGVNMATASHVTLTAPTMEGSAAIYPLQSNDTSPDLTYYNDVSSYPSTANGWVYNNMEYSYLAAPYGTNDYWYPSERAAIKWVKFQIPALAPGETGVITWSVSIK